jgi:hypothetical protein
MSFKILRILSVLSRCCSETEVLNDSNINKASPKKDLEHEISDKFIPVYRYMMDRSVIIKVYNSSRGLSTKTDKGLFMFLNGGRN